MAHVRKDTLTAPGEWRKHLRPGDHIRPRPAMNTNVSLIIFFKRNRWSIFKLFIASLMSRKATLVLPNTTLLLKKTDEPHNPESR